MYTQLSIINYEKTTGKEEKEFSYDRINKKILRFAFLKDANETEKNKTMTGEDKSGYDTQLHGFKTRIRIGRNSFGLDDLIIIQKNTFKRVCREE